MNRRKQIDRFYMDVASSASNLSRASRLRVGSVIVKDSNIISFGFNGTPPGEDNCCEERVYMADPSARLYEDIEDYPHIGEGGKRYRLVTKDNVIHAEENAILKLARSGGNGYASTMYCTHAPCIKCARMMKSIGIARLVYGAEYRSDEGVELLKKTIEVERFE